MSVTAEFFPKAIKYLTAAIEKDNQNELEEALRLYLLCFEYFVSGLKYSKNQKLNGTVKAKLTEFMQRAEVIKKELAAKEEEKRKKEQQKRIKTSSDNNNSSADGNALDEETKKLRNSLSDAILQEKPKLTWDDVAGLQAAKTSLEEAVILPQRFPQLFTEKRKPWKGILLYGPPGTGKSLLAKATAAMTNSTFFSISSSNLVSKWFGESEKLIRELFRMAMESKPAIIFIDEIDAVCGNRSDGENDATRRLKTEFLVQMQKVLDTDGVFVLGATNRPFDLDPAVRRRFEKRIYIPLPDSESRLELFKIHMGDEKIAVPQEYIDHVADITEGYSGSDISVVVRDVLMAPVRVAMRATHWKKVPNPNLEPGAPDTVFIPCSPNEPGAIKMSVMDIQNPKELLLPEITEENFQQTLKTIRPSVSKEDLEMQERFTRLYGQMGNEKRTPEQAAAELEAARNNNSLEEVQQLPDVPKDELEAMKHVNELTDKAEEEKIRRKMARGSSPKAKTALPQ